uniref:Uncharacterized protein n=1 Tax=Pithovirus LCPAC404 TaxID=2506597 RepID=A0A481ZEQ6_9VIRU|nr:MAG: hypothetical protein LCPAC404_01630 [Pithovirus LCPAC404]
MYEIRVRRSPEFRESLIIGIAVVIVTGINGTAILYSFERNRPGEEDDVLIGAVVAVSLIVLFIMVFLMLRIKKQ